MARTRRINGLCLGDGKPKVVIVLRDRNQHGSFLSRRIGHLVKALLMCLPINGTYQIQKLYGAFLMQLLFAWDIAGEKPWYESAVVAQMVNGIKLLLRKIPQEQLVVNCELLLLPCGKQKKLKVCVYTMAGNMVASFVKTRSYCSNDLDFDVRNACNKVLWSKNQRLQICKIWVLASLSEKGRCCGANKLQQSHPSFGARRPMWERFAFASGCKNSWMNFLESQGIRPLNLCWLIQSGHTSRRRCATRHKAVRKAASKRPGAPTFCCWAPSRRNNHGAPVFVCRPWGTNKTTTKQYEH